MSSETTTELYASFTRLRSGAWGVRVPFAAAKGEVVNVQKRDGSLAAVELTRIVWTDGAKVLATFVDVEKEDPSAIACQVVFSRTTLDPEGVILDFTIRDAQSRNQGVFTPLATLRAATNAPAIVASAPVDILTLNDAPASLPSVTKPLGKCATIDAAFSADTFVATSCACCGRTLTDPNSIETGMGPTCRRDHGYDVEDEAAAWAACFARLGASFPVDTYEAIVERHAHFVKASTDDQRRDVKRAVKLLVHRIAVADQARTDGATVLRCVLAIEALGYKRLARVLGRALVRRPALRSLRGAPRVAAMTSVKQGVFFVQVSPSLWIRSALRDAGVTFESCRGGYTVEGDEQALRAALTRTHADLVIDGTSIVCSRDMSDAAPRYVAWVDEGERTEWLDVDTNEWKRSALAGEPAHRPGWERVPSCFFATGTEVVARGLAVAS